MGFEISGSVYLDYILDCSYVYSYDKADFIINTREKNNSKEMLNEYQQQPIFIKTDEQGELLADLSIITLFKVDNGQLGYEIPQGLIN